MISQKTVLLHHSFCFVCFQNDLQPKKTECNFFFLYVSFSRGLFFYVDKDLFPEWKIDILNWSTAADIRIKYFNMVPLNETQFDSKCNTRLQSYCDVSNLNDLFFFVCYFSNFWYGYTQDENGKESLYLSSVIFCCYFLFIVDLLLIRKNV